MVTDFGGEGPGRRVCHAHKGIAATISKGCRSDLYIITGVVVQVSAWQDGRSIACNADLRAAHVNRIDYAVVIRSANHNVACAGKDVFIELHHQGTRDRNLDGTVCGCEIADLWGGGFRESHGVSHGHSTAASHDNLHLDRPCEIIGSQCIPPAAAGLLVDHNRVQQRGPIMNLNGNCRGPIASCDPPESNVGQTCDVSTEAIGIAGIETE